MLATLPERLAEIMRTMRWERADLVKASRQSSSVVSQWLGKGSKQIQSIGKMEAAEYLEQASGYSALWIAKGIGPKKAESHIDPTPQRSESLIAERAPSFSSQVLAAAAQIARDLEDKDDLTREQVATLLSRLCRQPSELTRVLEMLGRVFGVAPNPGLQLATTQSTNDGAVAGVKSSDREVSNSRTGKQQRDRNNHR